MVSDLVDIIIYFLKKLGGMGLWHKHLVCVVIPFVDEEPVWLWNQPHVRVNSKAGM